MPSFTASSHALATVRPSIARGSAILRTDVQRGVPKPLQAIGDFVAHLVREDVEAVLAGDPIAIGSILLGKIGLLKLHHRQYRAAIGFYAASFAAYGVQHYLQHQRAHAHDDAYSPNSDVLVTPIMPPMWLRDP